MDWNLIARDFEPDGSLRDIYVFKATMSDWQHVVEVLREWSPAPTFTIGGESQDLPERVEDIFSAGRQHGALLCTKVGGVLVNCHFFVESEIEFDLDPREITSATQIEAIVRFMTRLG